MTPRMAVLHVDPERGFSGGETQVLALARELRDAGHRNVVACHPGGELERRAIASGLECVALGVRRGHDPGAGSGCANTCGRCIPTSCTSTRRVP